MLVYHIPEQNLNEANSEQMLTNTNCRARRKDKREPLAETKGFLGSEDGSQKHPDYKLLLFAKKPVKSSKTFSTTVT